MRTAAFKLWIFLIDSSAVSQKKSKQHNNVLEKRINCSGAKVLFLSIVVMSLGRFRQNGVHFGQGCKGEAINNLSSSLIRCFNHLSKNSKAS
jgi:hypothetical protein